MNKPSLTETIHDIRFKAQKREEIFNKLSNKDKARVCMAISKFLIKTLLEKQPLEELTGLLEHLDPDEATDIIQIFPKRKQKKILEKLSENIKNAVELLIEFDPDSAAGLMNIDYIQLNENNSVQEALNHFKEHEKRTGRLPVMLVLSGNGKFIGHLPTHVFGIAKLNEKIQKYAKNITTVKHTTHKSDVIDLFKTYPHNKVVVLGSENQVVGIIYSDDVLRLLKEKEASTLYDFAGVSEEESVFDSAAYKIRSRYKWLIINLGTAFLAAFTIGLFEETLTRNILLAVYMPIVAGMGGNSATQTLAVMVRGISLKQIDLKSSLRTLKNEIMSGLANGIINGVIVAAIVITFNKDLKIAVILALAMIFNLIVAATFGTLIPLVMKKLNKDPAASATIFITTATDVLGFLAFLGLAALLLN